MRSFVTGRTQQIVVGSEKSTVFSSKSGVPQGSVLGPILFGLSSRRRHCTVSCTLPSVRRRHAVICVTKATRLRHDSQLGAVRHWRLAVVHWKCATAQSREDRGSDLWNKPVAKTSSQYTRRLGRRSPRQVLRRCQAPWSDTSDTSTPSPVSYITETWIWRLEPPQWRLPTRCVFWVFSLHRTSHLRSTQRRLAPSVSTSCVNTARTTLTWSWQCNYISSRVCNVQSHRLRQFTVRK